MHLLRDVLDKQVIDEEEEPLGRVDALVAELREGAPPRLLELQLGFVPLARRLSARAERWAEALHKRLGVRRSARYAIPWSTVTEVHRRYVAVALRAEETVAFDWERWLRRHVIGRIPGSGKEES